MNRSGVGSNFRPVTGVEELLRMWSFYFGERAPKGEDEGEATVSHPLARAAEFAPGRSARGTLGRAGQLIRKLTGTPAWATSPIPCKETPSHRTSTPDDIPADVRRVQAAVLALEAVHALAARVVTAQYCKRGTQAEKAQDLGIKLRRYRDELKFAKAWLSGHLTNY